MRDDLISRRAVIEAVDKHTKENGTLDDDITVILEEVMTAFDKEGVVEEMTRMTYEFDCSICPLDKDMEESCYEDGQLRCDKELINKLFEIVEKGGIE